MSLQLALTPATQLPAALPQLYWDIKRLAGVYRPKDRETNRRTLDEAMEVISREEPLESWSPFLCQRFVMTACALAREALLAGPPVEAPGTTGLLTAEQRGDLLCSFAAAAPQLPLMGKLQAGSVWVMTKLDGGPPLIDPEVARVEIVAALAPLNLPADEANDQVRAQIVLHVGRRIETGQRLSAEVENSARQWCNELLERGQLVTILHRAARNLGVNIGLRPAPAPDQDRPREQRFRVVPPPGLQTEATDRPRTPVEAPIHWKPPEELTPQAEQQEYLACLLKLQALARDKAGPITARTAESLYDLGPDSDLGFVSKGFYFAARELWKSYTQTGQPSHLDLARRAALLAFRGAPLEGDRRERAGALYLWMNTQLPLLITSCDLKDLIADAQRLYVQQGCRPGELYIRQGILEAHAGLSRQRAADGHADAKEQLVAANGPALQQIREEYLRLAAAVNYRPSEDALAAWDCLFSSTGAEHASADAPQTVPTILADPTFRDVIRRGSPEGVYQFADSRYQEIKHLLLRRLDVRLAPEHVLWPEGTIRNSKSTDNKTPDPAFIEARALLETSQYHEARSAFGQLAEQMQVRGPVNRPREICRNYEAFCWAKQGEPTFARNCLKELIDGDFPFPSAYWNYACCIALEEKDSRLGVLVKGLERAPHMLTLRAAVHLALELEDRAFLRQWLPCLVETEALLLAFYYDHPQLPAEARDPPVLRLAQYVMDGVEPFMPDPGNRELRSGEVNDFVGALLERRMDKAVEFWLRCREQEPSIRFRFDFWESKTDFLGAVRRNAEAAESFREEMRCRLNLIRSGKFKGPQIIFTTRKRLENWLNICMTPELRVIGQDIYEMVSAFERQGPDHPGLLPRLPRVHQYFREPVNIVRPTPSPRRNDEDHERRPTPVFRVQPPTPATTAASPRSTPLPDLLADSLDGNPIGIDPTAARSAFAVCVGFAQEDEGQEPPSPDPVRLRSAAAHLDDGTTLPLRDRLDQDPTHVSADQWAVLTFETPPGLRLDQPRTAVIDIRFEIAGAEHDAEPSEVTLVASPCPPLPEQSALGEPTPSHSTLDRKAVGLALAATLKGAPVAVPPETEDRLFEVTRGDPQAVQKIAAEMLGRARAEKRPVLTPHDAVAAAQIVPHG